MKRTLIQRLALCISLPDFLDHQDKCWPWTGRVSHLTLKPRKHITRHGGRRYPYMSVDNPTPVIQVEGKRQSPVRILYEIVTGNKPLGALQPNRRICPTPLCVNPRHRIVPGQPEFSRVMPALADKVLVYVAPDDIQDLIDLMHDHQSRHASVEELREAMGGDFTIAEYEQAFEREPDLKRDLIREGSNP
jgi:hypothetical protein